MAKGSPEREQMKLETTITSNCVCYKVDEDGEGVLDTDGEAVPNEYCYGDCYTEQVADFTDNILPYWLEAKAVMADSPVRINGSGMGWRGVSGHAETSARGIVKALEIDGDFILRITYEDGELSVVRSSHDELGASFSVEPISLDGESEWE
jgi:hypothetical protein